MDAQWLITCQAVISVFVVIATGGGLRKVGWLTAEADESLLRLVVRVLLPCLIFDKVVQSDAFDDVSNIILPPILGYAMVAVGIFVGRGVSRLGSRWTGLDGEKACMTFAACIGMFNYGFIPIPLISELFDQRTLGVLFIYNQGVELAIWTIGLLFISGSLGKSWWKHMINAPSVTIVVALAINLSGGAGYVPSFVLTPIALMGEAAIPMSMLLIGATIAEELMKPKAENGNGGRWKTASWGCMLRLGLLPPLFILAAAFVPGSIELKRVMVVEAAMPSAVFPIVLARHYGGAPRVALTTVLSNSLVSLLTIPLWILLGLRLIGDVSLGG